MSAAMTRLIRGRLLGNRWWYHCFQSFHACPAKAKAAADAEASLYRQFERWMVIHNKVYASETEKDLQFMQFKEDVKYIHLLHNIGRGPPLRLSKLILTGDVPDIFDDAERTHPNE
ncbi:hypothetical protein MLD38_019659 [Melastoma candidum]|uniref:Uncharacterized protein n=1 Tax=Melastoma candidum TaxID=119954 RepID=A0ACB9QY96_9MYRT|nr:hypothetical protein MLD38_019659 [Melastoma candidum]